MISSLIRAFHAIKINTPYASKSISVSAQGSNPVDMAFNSNGTKMYIMCLSNNTVYQYNLSTAWDLSTATYASLNKSVSAQSTYSRGLAFNSTGTIMYIANNADAFIYQYNLSTAWNVSTASYASVRKELTDGGQDIGLHFSPDGKKMYHGNVNSGGFSQYNLSTAWNVSTAMFFANLRVATASYDPTGFAFNSNGTKLYIGDIYADVIHQYKLSTAWDLSTATYDTLGISVSAQSKNPHGLAISSDGTKMFITDTTTDTVYQYDL